MKIELDPCFLIRKYPAISRSRNENGARIDFLKLLYPAIPRSRNETGARLDFFKIVVSGDSQKS